MATNYLPLPKIKPYKSKIDPGAFKELPYAEPMDDPTLAPTPPKLPVGHQPIDTEPLINLNKKKQQKTGSAFYGD